MTEEEWSYNSQPLRELEAFGIRPPKNMTQEAFDELHGAALTFAETLADAVAYGLPRSEVPFAKRTRTLERDTRHLQDWIEAVRDFDPEMAALRYRRPTPTDAQVKAAQRELFNHIREGRDFGTADSESIIFALIDAAAPAAPTPRRHTVSRRSPAGGTPATSPAEWVGLILVMIVVFVGLALFIASNMP